MLGVRTCNKVNLINVGEDVWKDVQNKVIAL